MEGVCQLKRICVFAGSSAGARPEYRAAAEYDVHLTLRQRAAKFFGGGAILRARARARSGKNADAFQLTDAFHASISVL